MQQIINGEWKIKLRFRYDFCAAAPSSSVASRGFSPALRRTIDYCDYNSRSLIRDPHSWIIETEQKEVER